MPPYIPPHLRKKTATAAPTLPASSKKGVHWPSNATGNPNLDVKVKTIKSLNRTKKNNHSRSSQYKSMSRSLTRRKLRNKPIKTILRGKTAKKLEAVSAPSKL